MPETEFHGTSEATPRVQGAASRLSIDAAIQRASALSLGRIISDTFHRLAILAGAGFGLLGLPPVPTDPAPGPAAESFLDATLSLSLPYEHFAVAFLLLILGVTWTMSRRRLDHTIDYLDREFLASALAAETAADREASWETAVITMGARRTSVAARRRAEAFQRNEPLLLSIGLTLLVVVTGLF